MDENIGQIISSVPPVTRAYLVGVMGTTLAVQFKYISPLRLYFNANWIVKRRQYWRLLSSFFFFGNLSFDFFFHVFFIIRYSKMLEEGSEWFRRRPGEYLWFMLLIMSSLVGVSLGYWALMNYVVRVNVNSLMMLSQSLSSAIVYLWSRRNPSVRMSFLGIFTFKAPYLPFVLLGLSLVVSSTLPVDDMLGIFIGHLYFFGQDALPQESRRLSESIERRWFSAPKWFRTLYCAATFQQMPEDQLDGVSLTPGTVINDIQRGVEQLQTQTEDNPSVSSNGEYDSNASRQNSVTDSEEEVKVAEGPAAQSYTAAEATRSHPTLRQRTTTGRESDDDENGHTASQL